MSRHPSLSTLSIAALLACPVAPSSVDAQSPDTDIFVGRVSGQGVDLEFGGFENVTRRSGYDNQPSFTPDSRAILYTVQADGQTDIYRYDLAAGQSRQVTSTPESEYSATVMPGGGRFSVIRVEADSTQRLWSFDMSGAAPELVLTEIAPVGYHAWLDESTLGLFVLGAPATLQIADVASGEARTAAHDIGRSLHRVPGRRAVSFLHRDGGVATIRVLEATGRAARDLTPPVEDSQDYAWTPDGILVMGTGSELFAFDPLTDSKWRQIADLASFGVSDITRLAISPDGRHIAVVASGN